MSTLIIDKRIINYDLVKKYGLDKLSCIDQLVYLEPMGSEDFRGVILLPNNVGLYLRISPLSSDSLIMYEAVTLLHDTKQFSFHEVYKYAKRMPFLTIEATNKLVEYLLNLGVNISIDKISELLSNQDCMTLTKYLKEFKEILELPNDN